MNIDFSLNPGFSWYVVLLMISGLITICTALVPASGLSTGLRIFSGLAGAAFFGYGVYLAFFFEGSEYLIIFKAFIVPIVLVANFVRSMMNRAKGTPVPPQGQVPYPGQAPFQGQAPYPGQAPYQGQAQPPYPGQIPTQPQAPVQPQAPQQQIPTQPTAPVQPAAGAVGTDHSA
ncbi:hypothetical protein [Kitasatospora fiedleri]|uniref:hypothetical protein n=1 Tax=Kitasatospora fiedleri TaxID=2991545 RepID=UPI00249AF869|nr:hypothetical protein [Kitasatospora fiedleri]